MSHRFALTARIGHLALLVALLSGIAFGQAKSFIPVEGATL